MTAQSAAATRSSRFPVRRDLDGDFAPGDVIRVGAKTGLIPANPHDGLNFAALNHQVWRLDLPVDDGRLLGAAGLPVTPATIGEPSESDMALLHAFEVCGLWRPPVSHNLYGLSAPRACVWLAIAERWVLLSHTSGDLRLLNAACKLVGAVWTRWHTATDDGWPSVAGPLAHTARLIGDASQYLAGRLNRYPTVPAPATNSPPWPTPAGTPLEAPSIMVLAGAKSTGAQQFLAGLPQPSPLTAVCWYDAPASAVPADSAYANAWYPPEAAATRPPSRSGARLLPSSHQHTARTWDDVAGTIRHHRADLIVLIGMPIVPTAVLSQARLGVVNAHNGALPHYRGMDAVGWAVLNNDPIVCTLHLAAPAVDQGGVITAALVPYGPRGSLRVRVKATQLELLQTVTLGVATTGHPPTGTPQGTGRQYYRLHPHLKRVLDAWSDNLPGRN